MNMNKLKSDQNHYKYKQYLFKEKFPNLNAHCAQKAILSIKTPLNLDNLNITA